jgi:phospholipid/cholesterol/gamma-HCH transport system ATP-binding protein
MNNQPEPHIIVKDLAMAFGDFVVLRDLTFTVNRGDIFIIMGGSGCGKTTLLRGLVGLQTPAEGQVFYKSVNFWDTDSDDRRRIMKRFGILYQGGALWSSLTLAENVALPLQELTDLGTEQIRELVSLKLSLVGLAGFEEFYPSEISGGMRKRAGLARAMALDPEILFFDEPSAGLDPISAHLLDNLILELRDSLGATVVVVTHELSSIFAIGNNSVFLDPEEKTIIAGGDPKKLLEESQDPKVHRFLTRGEEDTVRQQ